MKQSLLPCLLILCARALAQPGLPDPAFGVNGIVTHNFGTIGSGAGDVAVQPDGKLVVAGFTRDASADHFLVTRYNADGSLDAGFDGDGQLITSFGIRNDDAYAVLIQPDGKILVAGTTQLSFGSNFAVARYLSNGSPDNSFDGDGKASFGFPGTLNDAQAIALQPDGKILVTGSTELGGVNVLTLGRLNANGSVDLGFSGDGLQTTLFDGLGSFGYAVAVQPDGRIVVTGHAGLLSGPTGVAIARFLANGLPDLSFSGDGELAIVINDFRDEGHAIAFQPDGKLLIAGSSAGALFDDFLVIRCLADGSLDPSFDGDGIQTADFFGSYDIANDLAIQADGKILLGGFTRNVNEDIALLRVHADGIIDASFSGDGKVNTNLGGDERSQAIALSGLRIYSAGFSAGSPNPGLAIAAYQNDIGPLPVQLTSLSGEWRGHAIILNWTTASESAANRFEVERSPDAMNFSGIGMLPARGNSAGDQAYRFMDDSPLAANNFYRLKMVDDDGGYTYSRTLLLRREDSDVILVCGDGWLSPNPVGDELRIHVPSQLINVGIQQPIGYTILDATGRTISRGLIPAGASAITIATTHVAPGWYVCVVSGRTICRSVFIRK